MRFIIGIDLGTTNSCVAYIDTDQTANPTLAIQTFKLPQFVLGGFLAEEPTLASCCYLLKPEEEKLYPHPFGGEINYLVGKLARSLGSKTNVRSIVSAKSWLCHSAAHRKDPILPEGGENALKISPVEATSRYLKHIREAWNATLGKDFGNAFEEQEIILTVPASFDEVARSLTVDAAKNAGFATLTLLEEPQAAFYSWLAQHQHNWQKKINLHEKVVVCDVGGGTTDFSLIEVVEKESTASFQRMAVGNHLLLGGDNMDVAIAHYLEKKAGTIDPHHWPQLIYEARLAKEVLLSNPKQNCYSIALLGSGSSVVKGSIRLEITREELTDMLLSGFFEKYSFEQAVQLKKTVGIKTMGLPFENEPSITKHLAAFLKQNQAEPDWILFNGGTLKPAIFQNALLQSLQNWFPHKKIDVLESFSLDLAVARGAAYYGKARRGLGVKIGGGIAKSFYLEIGHGAKTSLLTIMPRGSDEGFTYKPEDVFLLSANTPVAFNFYASHTRLHDPLGSIVNMDPLEMQPLPPIRTVLKLGKTLDQVPVKLEVFLSSIGIIELWLKSTQTHHRFKLEFQLKNASNHEDAVAISSSRAVDETHDDAFLDNAKQIIEQAFTPQSQVFKPSHLMDSLERALHHLRKDWSPAILRGLFQTVLATKQNKLSLSQQVRWWNLIGFLLRPGFGYPLDDFRLKELWKIILPELKIKSDDELWIQQLICFRRIAGGLNKGQQTQIASTIFPKSEKLEIKGNKELYLYTEKIRTYASLEWLDLPLKQKMGEWLLNRILTQKAEPAEYWAFGRIGARSLLYATFSQVLPRKICQEWLEKLLQNSHLNLDILWLPIGQLARKTDHREINLPESVLQAILSRFEPSSHIDRLKELLYHQESLSSSEQEEIFGEKLPPGLMLK